MNVNKAYGNIQSGFLGKLLRFPGIALIVHWTFQGVLYMGWTERLYKISLDIMISFLMFIGFQSILHWKIALLLSLLTAHTINFFFNGQFWAVLKCFGLVHTADDEFFSYVKALAQRAGREPSIQALIAYGSLARKERTPNSDLDARIIRKPGLVNGIRACTFLMLERSRALLARFPLDMYVVDTPFALEKLRPDEREQRIDLIAQTKSSNH
ncbi:MAG: DUF294 nucleotidyltransferase-like domain-containing protein [Anaerolineales bacterium]